MAKINTISDSIVNTVYKDNFKNSLHFTYVTFTTQLSPVLTDYHELETFNLLQSGRKKTTVTYACPWAYVEFNNKTINLN